MRDPGATIGLPVHAMTLPQPGAVKCGRSGDDHRENLGGDFLFCGPNRLLYGFVPYCHALSFL